MRCLNCGKLCERHTVTQRFCSELCGNRYRKKNIQIITWPSITFECAECKKTVVTKDGSGDLRTKFCSATCEKKYWRHPRSRTGNLEASAYPLNEKN